MRSSDTKNFRSESRLPIDAYLLQASFLLNDNSNLICLWEFSHYGCLQDVSHNGHNRKRFNHVTKFMKYIVHGWDAQCRELSEVETVL